MRVEEHMEELFHIMKERRSVRKFSSVPVTDEEIRLLLEAARWAPSNSNRQAWRFLCIRNDDVKQAMADVVEEKVAKVKAALTDQEMIAAFDRYAGYLTFFKDAPLVIVALSKHAPIFLEKISCTIGISLTGNAVQPEVMSVSMAIQNIQLAAEALGLGSCCMTGPVGLAASELQTVLNVQAPFELSAIVPVGRYDRRLQAPPRKDISLISEIID